MEWINVKDRLCRKGLRQMNGANLRENGIRLNLKMDLSRIGFLNLTTTRKYHMVFGTIKNMGASPIGQTLNRRRRKYKCMTVSHAIPANTGLTTAK